MRENINRLAKYVGWAFLVILVVAIMYDFLRRGIYDEKTGLNLLIVGDENVGMLVIRPNENVINWISLPTSLKVKINSSSATYPVNSLWKFAGTEKRPYQITERTMGDTVGVVIPRMIKVDGVANVENILSKFLSLGTKTDLSFRDRWLIRKIVTEAAVSKKIFELEIPKTAFDKLVEADGKEFLVANKVLDVWSKDKFYHDNLMEEGAEVTINNVSNVSGAALLLSNQLDAAGFRVVHVENNDKDNIRSTGCRFLAPNNFPVAKKYLVDQVGCTELPKDEGKDVNSELIKIWLK